MPSAPLDSFEIEGAGISVTATLFVGSAILADFGGVRKLAVHLQVTRFGVSVFEDNVSFAVLEIAQTNEDNVTLLHPDPPSHGSSNVAKALFAIKAVCHQTAVSEHLHDLSIPAQNTERTSRRSCESGQPCGRNFDGTIKAYACARNVLLSIFFEDQLAGFLELLVLAALHILASFEFVFRHVWLVLRKRSEGKSAAAAEEISSRNV